MPFGHVTSLNKHFFFFFNLVSRQLLLQAFVGDARSRLEVANSISATLRQPFFRRGRREGLCHVTFAVGSPDIESSCCLLPVTAT